MIETLLLYAAVLVVASGATWAGSVRLERAASRLSALHGLPALVQGTLVVAVASSLPELTTVVVSAAIHGDFSLGMASIVGSAVFNILVIPGLSALVGEGGGGVEAELRLVYRDALFYLTAVSVLLLTFSFAIIYQPLDGGGLTGRLTRLPVLVPLLLYGLYLFLQEQEILAAGSGSGPRSDRSAEEDTDARGRDGDGGSEAGAWVTLGLGILLVLAGVEALLRVAIGLGDLLGTPSFLWGATMVAGATSVPDAIISLRSARRGEGEVSTGNVLGSNIFDLLVAIPVGVLVAGAAVVDYSVAAPLMGALTLGTVVLFATLRTDLRLSPGEGWLLLGLYAAFLAWLGCETAGVTTFLGATVGS